MPFPLGYSATLADAAMGSTREADRQAEAAEVRKIYDQMQDLVDLLRSSALADRDGIAAIEHGLFLVWRALP